jgi:peptidyl-tRNA hydrolase
MSTELADTDELPALTPKQHAFVRALLKGKTASDAYRGAYDCEGMAANSIWVAASRLRSDAKVALWLRQYRLAALQEGVVTLTGHLGELTRLREQALHAKQAAAAVQAEHYRGKAAGLYEDRLRLASGPSDAELIKTIKALLGEDVAEAISAGLGAKSEF